LDGFVRAVGIQDQIIRRLINDGVVKVQPREGVSEVATDSATLN
jgi:ribosomal protein L19E